MPDRLTSIELTEEELEIIVEYRTRKLNDNYPKTGTYVQLQYDPETYEVLQLENDKWRVIASDGFQLIVSDFNFKKDYRVL